MGSFTSGSFIAHLPVTGDKRTVTVLVRPPVGASVPLDTPQ